MAFIHPEKKAGLCSRRWGEGRRGAQTRSPTAFSL